MILSDKQPTSETFSVHFRLKVIPNPPEPVLLSTLKTFKTASFPVTSLADAPETKGSRFESGC